LQNAARAGFGLCVGDGCPDEKLKLGVAATQAVGAKAAFFLKPYPQDKLFERIEWVRPYASHIGIDIDSYNIVTMRNLVNLERKSAGQLQDFREHTKLPFIIKGVFTPDDLTLVSLVRPDVVYISNHGGRVETRIGSTAHFLAEHAGELKKYCKEIWVDGGIRTKQDVQTALYYGADQVIVARPLIRATFDEHYDETVKELLQ
jgi:isopentenyl diphosphate isomerase/L-lactate dehydrogenase-like FMN-dependent dehydrogenase